MNTIAPDQRVAAMSADDDRIGARSLAEVYDRRLARKILTEFAHERAIAPTEVAAGRYTVLSDDRRTEYSFDAEVLSLDSWLINEDSLTRTRDRQPLPVRSVELIIDLADQLGISAADLPEYLEEVGNTLSIGAGQPDSRRIPAADLAAADFQTIEQTMTDGHPCFVANAGRLGFSAADVESYAPESGNRFRLIWVAARSEDCDFAAMSGVDYTTLLRDELGDDTLARFATQLAGKGLDPAHYRYLPAHPWQWTEKIARLHSAEIAANRLVNLGESPDLYQPQQSIRSMFNISHPHRHYVKSALSIVNMGFTRGMSADYMRTTPLINDWVRRRVGDDDYLQSIGFQILYEVAAIGYRNPTFYSITPAGSEYRKMLSALWRQSPITRIADHQQLTTMAALLHLDHRGHPLIAAFIQRSGLAVGDWLHRYLRAYLHPIMYLLYRHELKFSPHGENLILVLESGIPVRAFLKDIGEEVSIFASPDDLPDDARRALAQEPDAIRNLGVLSDVFDDFFRPLAAILHAHKLLSDRGFWSVVATSVAEFIGEHPDLADRFARWDLFAPSFAAVHMNALHMGNNRRMVTLGDSYASIMDSTHLLDNPIANGGNAQ